MELGYARFQVSGQHAARHMAVAPLRSRRQPPARCCPTQGSAGGSALGPAAPVPCSVSAAPLWCCRLQAGRASWPRPAAGQVLCRRCQAPGSVGRTQVNSSHGESACLPRMDLGPRFDWPHRPPPLCVQAARAEWRPPAAGRRGLVVPSSLSVRPPAGSPSSRGGPPPPFQNTHAHTHTNTSPRPGPARPPPHLGRSKYAEYAAAAHTATD